MEEDQEVFIGEIGIIEDILRRLPVKSLVRFQCVSKQWRSLISDPAFLRKHTSCTGGHSRPWKLGRILKSPRLSIDDFSLITFYGDGKHRTVGLDNMGRPDVTFKPSILGSCDGLLLLRILENDFVMWNPFTRSSRRISGLSQPGMLRNADIASGLAYDGETDDYKAVVIASPRDSQEGAVHPYVFSYRRNSWTRKDSRDFPYELKSSFFNGVMVNCSPHWVVKRAPIPHSLVYFHAASEKFGELPLPRSMMDWESDFFIKLGLLKGCLSLTMNSDFYSRDVTVWSMMKYGEVDSWTKLHTLKVPWGSYFLRPIGYCTSEGREALVMEKDRKQLVVFDVPDTTRRRRRRRIITEYVDHPDDTFAIYFESIVSPWGL